MKRRETHALYVIMDKGHYGIYNKALPNGKHLILEAQYNWPFPKHHELERNQFKYARGVERQTEEQYEEAPF